MRRLKSYGRIYNGASDGEVKGCLFKGNRVEGEREKRNYKHERSGARINLLQGESDLRRSEDLFSQQILMHKIGSEL
jgi:hypothetical protein